MGQHGKYRALVIWRGAVLPKSSRCKLANCGFANSALRRAAHLLGFLCAFGLFSPAHAQPCRQALALGLDVSGSVDAREYRLQVEGIAEALADPGVQTAIFADPSSTVDLLIFEWSGVSDQRLLLDWTPLTDRARITEVQEILRNTKRDSLGPGTALGSAMLAGRKYLKDRTNCRAKTLDISGDGKSNLGPPPADLRASLSDTGITVNALVIGTDTAATPGHQPIEIGELTAYFRADVITGPDAFVETALGFDTYAAAMTRKLEKELRGLTLSALTP